MFDVLGWALAAALSASPTAADSIYHLQSAAQDPYAALVQTPDGAAALARATELAAWVNDQQVSRCETEAPPYQEQKRAAAYKAVFEALGLRNGRIDRVGNVLGERPGTGGGPHVVFSA